MRPYPGHVATIAVLVLVATCIQVGVPLAIRGAIDSAIGGHVGDALRMALAVVAGGLLAQGAALAEAWIATDLGQRSTNDLRAELTTHVIGLDSEFHAANPPGALIERVDGDTATLSALFSRLAIEMVQAILVLSGVLVVTAIAAPPVATGLVMVLAVTALALRAVVRGGHRWRIARSADGAAFYGVVEERLAGVEDTRATGAVPFATWQLEVAARNWLRSSFGALAWNAGTSATVAISIGLMTAITFIGGAAAVGRGAATVGDVVALLAYLEVLRRPVEQLARQAREVGNAIAGAARVADLLATGGDPQAEPGHSRPGQSTSGTPARDDARSLPPGALPVTLTEAEVTYPGAMRAALAPMTVSIPAGAFVGVTGHTSSGKTTLGRLVTRAILPSGGTVHLAGTDLGDVTEDELRARVVVVGQDVALFHATVRNNVSLFDPTVRDDDIRRALELVGLGEWLGRQRDGLSTHLAPSGAQGGEGDGVQVPGRDAAHVAHGGLSAGEAQLVGLARAFVRDAGLVILDEPTARVDPATEARLDAALTKCTEGRTVIAIAHRGAILAHATHRLHLDAGHVVHFGVATVHAGASDAPAPVSDPVPADSEDPAPIAASSGAGEPVAPRVADRHVGWHDLARSMAALIRGFPIWWAASISLAGIIGYAMTLGTGIIQKAYVDALAVGGTDGWALGAVAVAFGVVRGGHVLATVVVEPWTQSRSAATLAINAAAACLASRRWPPVPVSPGDAVSRLRDDAAVIGRFTTYLGDPFGQVIIVGTAWALLASDDPLVAVGAFAPIVLLMVVAQLASPVVERTRRAAAQGVASVTDLLGDAFAHATAIRLAGATDRVVAAVVARGEARRRAALREALVVETLRAAWRHAGTVAAGALLVAAVPGLAAGTVTAGDAALGVSFATSLTFLGDVYGELVLLVRGSFVALGRIGALAPDVPTASFGATRPLRLLGGDPLPAPSPPASRPDDRFRELAVRDLTFRHGGAFAPSTARSKGLLAPLPSRRGGGCGQDRVGAPMDRTGRPPLPPGAGASLPRGPGGGGRPGAHDIDQAEATLPGGGIEGATFTVRAGTLVALTGPAGAGKTTLVRSLLGIVPATGELRWNGQVVADPAAWMVPPRVAATTQVPRLFSGTVQENVLPRADRGAPSGGREAARDARILDATTLAGLDRDLADGLLDLGTRVGPRGVRLSGGQQQRLAAARMFATGAPLLIVDDLSSALDEATESIVWDRVLARPDVTVIAVTNRPSVIARASQVIAVEGGRCRVVRG